MNLIKYLALTTVPIALLGCSSGGDLDMKWTDEGISIRGDQHPKAVTPFEVTATSDGDLTVSTGAPQESTPSLLIAEGSSILFWIGPIIGVLGVVALVGKKWLPFLPGRLGVYLIGAGLAVTLLPSVIGPLVSIPWWVYAAAGVWALIDIVPDLVANLKDPRKAPKVGSKKGPRLDPKTSKKETKV
jgi:hypothetical protein